MLNKICKKNEPLSKHCTFRVGGPADFFCEAKSPKELEKMLDEAKSRRLAYFVMGGGSNVLFSDKGFRGIVIKIAIKKLEVKGKKIIAGAGVTISDLIKTAANHNLGGLEKWSGLPGTVGGAVRGNAGCNGLETSRVLTECEVINAETGEIKTLKNKDLNYAYRESRLKYSREIVLNATFELKRSASTSEERKLLLEKLSRARQKTQPPGFSSGSFFKNPSPENPAGKLIDKAGLKGKQIGKAVISQKHGNFIQNLGGASARDILALAKLIKQEVKTKFNIKLEEEVQIVDEYNHT